MIPSLRPCARRGSIRFTPAAVMPDVQPAGFYIIEGLSNCLPRNEKETLLALKMGFPENIRLGCQTRIVSDHGVFSVF